MNDKTRQSYMYLNIVVLFSVQHVFGFNHKSSSNTTFLLCCLMVSY